MVHRLVAAAFLKKPPNYRDLDVTHIDGDKLNNHVDNLKYCTKEQVAHHSRRVLKRGHQKRVGQKPVVMLDKITDKHIKTFETVTEAAVFVGTNDGSIIRVCNGGRKSCKGYKFIYLDELTDE
jgi:hypothetical protein